MKKLIISLAVAVVAGISVLAFAAETGQTPVSHRPARAVRSNPNPAYVPPVARVKGGVNADKPLYGSLYSLSYGNFDGQTGIFEIKANGNHVAVASLPQLQSGCYFGGMFLGMTWSANTIGYHIYNADTWEPQLEGDYVATNAYVFAVDLTYDPESRKIYGYFIENAASYDCTKGKFGFIDPDGFNPLDPVTVFDTDFPPLRGIAADGKGKVYGVSLDNEILEINKTNGSTTKVADISWMERPSGATCEYYTGSWQLGYESAEIDWETGKIYFSGYDDMWDTYIATIDPATGQAECIADFGYDSGTGGDENFCAIFFKQQAEASADAPEAVGGLTVTPLGTELKASVKFTLPTKSATGTDLTGSLDWTVTDGNSTLAEGTGKPGETVETTIEVAAGGFCNISVYASAAGSKGSDELAKVFIGPDTPVVIDIPDVYPDGNEATVVWSAARALNGGNLAPVSYRVVRMPEGKVVAEATTELNVTDKLDNDYKTRCTYDVTPVAGTLAGETVSSRPTYVGTVFAIPHADAFDDATLFNEYPAIDANNDGNTWWIDTNRKAAVYSASSTLAGNDYLCIGPFDLLAGCAYTFSMTADGHNRVERVAAYVGTDPSDASTFSTRIIDETLVNPSVGEANLSGEFTPATSGRYYFGIHACSNANATNLYIYNAKVSGTTPEMPVAPALTFTPRSATEAALTIVVPEKTLGGDAAKAIAIRLYRDNEQIAEITDGVTDGATIEYVDNTTGTSNGKHVYTAAAVNAAGEGQLATVEAWLGADQPGEPKDMRVWEDIDTPGLIHLTWQPPVKGANGGFVDPSTVTYMVDWLSFGVTGSGERNVGSALKFDLQLSAEAQKTQDVIAFTVKGVNPAGTAGSRSSETRSTYTGPALPLPLHESWAGSKHSSGIWSGESIMEDEELFESWWDYSDGKSQDADGYLMAMSTTKAGGGYRIRAPRITVADAKQPVLVFHYYLTQLVQDLTVEVAVDDQPFATLKEIPVKAAETDRWIRAEIPLDAYKKNKYIQFAFSAHASAPGVGVVGIDNVNIVDRVDGDIKVIGFEGPKKVQSNGHANFTATLRNAGFKDLDGSEYTVNLFKNGELIDEADGWPVASFENVAIDFVDVTTVTDPEVCTYSVEVVFADDANPADNVSGAVSVRVETPDYPTPTALSAADHSQGVELKWTAPEQGAIPGRAVTETFDTYEPFVFENFGDWTTYDVDGAPTVILATSLGVLDYPNIGKPMAWQVLDPSAANIIAGAFYCRSGQNMLASFQACRDGGRDVNSNDWLVSPELDGSAQTISFYARCGMGGTYAPEVMDIYVSDSGIEMADFKILKKDVEVPYLSDWEEFVYTLPAGTKHFAIVHKSFNKLALLIDDVTYIPAGSDAMDLTLEGYNVYRNGKRITSSPVVATSFIDTDVAEGDSHSYNVTSVWDKGESRFSETARIENHSALTSAATAAIGIRAGVGEILVEGAEGLTVNVYNAAGICVASVNASAVTTIPISTGIYLVHAGSATAKVAVK